MILPLERQYTIMTPRNLSRFTAGVAVAGTGIGLGKFWLLRRPFFAEGRGQKPHVSSTKNTNKMIKWPYWTVVDVI
ncbi:hypothetical protein JAAARDRAFT_474079 [Jaapia argillacea MUCL 33604]|uniref:Uncharacterized protein n=1 Tax=Jaapia argillacea MUCL 33604 TaxID=933084 RepID=A0A067PCP2_9AGAM|nr:hypothetical protein JAAARDRAFT_474079 [Jaapia argillacea MUCL 33604]